jgi:hypothetical protein
MEYTSNFACRGQKKIIEESKEAPNSLGCPILQHHILKNVILLLIYVNIYHLRTRVRL